MTAQETFILESGQCVGLAVANYPKELVDFAPLQAADTDRAELVAAIEVQEAAQDATTADTTTAKDDARELMARATETLSARAVGYALATRQLRLRQAFMLSYADVRYGDLGPKTAKYLAAQFEGADGGQATVVVRRVG